MELKIVFDEEKMREIVADAVERLKAEGYIWRDQEDQEDQTDGILGETQFIGSIQSNQ